MIAPLGLIFTIYALAMYRRRTRAILDRKTLRYDDQAGPLLLTLGLAVVMGAAYIIAMRGAFHS